LAFTAFKRQEVQMPGRGRPFVKGGPPGPGRPRKVYDEVFLDVVRQEIGAEEIRKLIRGLLKRADEDHPERATELLFRLVFGIGHTKGALVSSLFDGPDESPRQAPPPGTNGQVHELKAVEA
jgi:hypothetical protein